MKSKLTVVLAAAILSFFTSCEKVVGEGPIVTETRNVANFKGVSISVSGRVNYKIDPAYKVEVQAQQNILDVLETKLIGDELVVKVKDGKRIRSNEEITVNISAPYADFLNLNGSANVYVTGGLATTSTSLKVSGSGSINADQVTLTDKLTVNISGSGDIKINQGNVKNEVLKISGSGKIDLGNVITEKAVAEISGSGDMWIHVTQNLDAHISGSGSVRYRGTPVITTHISGSGKVQPF